MHLAGTMEHCSNKSSEKLKTRITKQNKAKETQQSVICWVLCYSTENFKKVEWLKINPTII